MDTKTLAALRATHELYCHLTGQKLTLRFDRERLWYEFLRAGFSDNDLKTVVAYLQKEIRASRRNVGALKYPTFCSSIASRRTSTSAKSNCAALRPPAPHTTHPPIHQLLPPLNGKSCGSKLKTPLRACANSLLTISTLNLTNNSPAHVHAEQN